MTDVGSVGAWNVTGLTLTAEDSSNPQVTVRASDGRGGFDEQTFAINVVSMGGRILGRVNEGIAQHVSALINADDTYALYKGKPDGTGLTLLSQPGTDPGGLESVNQHDFELGPGEIFFVVAWDISHVRNMFVGQFDLPGGRLLTNLTDWEYTIGTGPNPGTGYPHTNTVRTDIETAIWDLPKASAQNNGSNPWGQIFSPISPDALLIWPDTLSASSIATETYVVFRPRPTVIDTPLSASWTVYLDQNRNGQRDSNERFTMTNADGNFAFMGLAPGTYFVREEPQPGWRQTFPRRLATSGNLLTNGSFEQGIEPGESITLTSGSTDIVGWTVTRASIDYKGWHIAAADGSRSIDLAGIPAAGGIAQTFSTVPGTRYLVTFDLAGNPVGSPLVKHMRVEAAGQFAEYSFDTIGQSTSDPGWLTRDWEFEATDTQTTVEFISLTNDLYGPLIDDVSLVALDRHEPHIVDLGAGEVMSGIDFENVREVANVENRRPTFTTTPPYQAAIAQRYLYHPEAADLDDDLLAFDLVVRPERMVIDPTTGILFWTPAPGQEGTVDVVLRVQDSQGGVALQSFQITVDRLNTAPVISSIPPAGPASVGHPFRYKVRAQDAEGDPVGFHLDACPVGMTIDSTTGLIAWTPTAGQASNHPVVIVATDARGASSRQFFDLSVVADAPNDAPTIGSTAPTTVQLGNTYYYAVLASDPNGDPLRYIVETGTPGMVIDSEGLVSWTPTADQFGPHPVTIRVEDGRGGVASQDFAVTVATQASNQPPTIVSTPAPGIVAGLEYRYDARATDPDGDPIVWSLDAAPAGMSLDQVTGSLRWTPTSGHVGAQSIVLRATDARGGMTTQTFAVTVRAVNTPPAVVSTPPTQAHAGSAYLYAVRATDPDGDPLTFTLFGPPGMTIDPATGMIRWAPTAQDVAIHEIVVLVSDGQATSTQIFDLDVSASTADRPPTLSSTPTYVATVDAPYAYQVTASDPEGQALRYTLLAAPAGMTIGATTGRIEWTPTAGQLGGPHAVTVAALDPAGNGASQSFTITVRAPNRAPMINSTPITIVTAGLPYRYDVRASDPDGDQLTFGLGSAPAGMTIDPTLGRITWSPGIADIGSHPVVVTVTDARGLSAGQPFDVVVQADTQEPRVALSLSANPAPIGSTVTFLVSAVDNVGVQALDLLIDGNPVVLDATGRVVVPMNVTGSFAVVARATDAAGNVGQATATLLVTDPSDLSPPVAEISTPTDDQVITSFLDVLGTVTDPNLVSYTLAIALASGGQFTEIARGSSAVVNGQLGRLDSSLLANDSYVLRLTATDTGGNSSIAERAISVAGDLKLGNFTLSFTDLTVPVSGIPITVTRTYDSLNATTGDDFGHGWRLEFADTDLRTSVPKTGMEADGFFNPFRDQTRVYVTLPGGRREGFTFQPQPAPGLRGSFLGIHEARFVPDAGVTSTLSVQSFDLKRFSDGSYGDYSGALPYNPADSAFGGRFTLTTREGIAYTIDGRTGDLITVADRNGNALTFTDAGIFSKSGQQVTFERDPRGRITAVVDPMGQRIRYAYDADGDLVSVTDRENNTTRFEYDEPRRPHFLTGVIDPLGRDGIRSEYDEQGRLVRLIDADGHDVRLVHDPDNFTETVHDQLGNPTIYEYDDRGNVLVEVDALGGTTTRTYDLNNNMLTETNPLGRTTTFTHDAAGNVLTTTDPLGLVTRSTYDAFGNALTITDPVGNTTTNVFDARGNLLEIRDPSGKVTTLTYDASGNPTSMADPVGTLFQFEYDAFGNVTRQVDPLGHATVTTYDAAGRPLTESRTLTTPAGVRTLVTTTTYDAEGRVIAVEDAEGNVTRTEYDAAGNRAASIDALGRRTEYRHDDRGLLIETIFPDDTPGDATDNPRTRVEYDAAGREVARIDESGRRTELRYDSLGRLEWTIHPDATPANPNDNSRTHTVFDAAGQVLAQVDERGNRTEFGYDLAGRQVIVRDALGHETRTTYDDAGHSVAVTDALGRTTRFDYDASGRPIRTLFIDGTTTATTYDERGRVRARADQLGRTTEYEYDAADRLTAVVDALGQRTEYTYDESGNLIAQTDANDHTTEYEYDGLGRRTATVLPLGQRATMAFDAVGNVLSTTDFNGDTIAFEYDPRNRLTVRVFPDSTSVRFTYTPTGLRETVVDGRGTTTYAYDERNRLISRTAPDGRVITYTYDAAGNRTSVAVPSGTTSYTFDALNRPATVTDPDLGVTRYTYDAIGNLVRTELPNGTVESRAYDNLKRLLFLENTSPLGVISSSRYTLAPTGRRDAVVEHDGRQVNYQYDALDRLIDELITEADATTRTISYEYDPVGNRLARDDSAEGRTAYTYDANDRLLTETLGARVTQYTYDANGNTLSKVTDALDRALYEWDVENRLVGAEVTDAAGTRSISYEYDADGIRVASIVDGAETRYLIDTVQPYAQVLEEYTPGGVIMASYVHGLDLISMDRGEVRSTYHVDGLGSTRSLTNATGQVTDRYVYDAFGRTIGQVGVTGNVYLFAGEQRDANVGLDYLRARYLDPATGRFFGQDPFNGSLHNPLTLPDYLYVLGNPINKVDPTGRFAVGLAEINGVLSVQNSLRLASGFERYSSYLNKSKALVTGIQLSYDLISIGATIASVLGNGPTIAFQQEWTLPSSRLFFEDRFEFSFGVGFKNLESQRLLLVNLGLSGAKASGKGGIQATFALDPTTYDLDLAESDLSSTGSLVLFEIRPRFSLGNLVPLQVLGTVGLETRPC